MVRRGFSDSSTFRVSEFVCDMVNFSLGSRLIDRQSQERTAAARATVERKTLGHLA